MYGKRATPFEVLSEFSERVGETYALDEVLPRMAQLLAEAVGATRRVWLRSGPDWRPVGLAPVDPEDTAPVRAAGDQLPTWPAPPPSPSRDQGDLLGAITLRCRPTIRWIRRRSDS